MTKWVQIGVSFAAPDDFTWDGCPSNPALANYADRLMDGAGLCKGALVDEKCDIDHSAGGSIHDNDDYAKHGDLCDNCKREIGVTILANSHVRRDFGDV